MCEIHVHVNCTCATDAYNSHYDLTVMYQSFSSNASAFVSSHDPASTAESSTSRSQSLVSSSTASSSSHAEGQRAAHEGDFSLPHYGVQQIPQTYKELAEPWIKVRCRRFESCRTLISLLCKRCIYSSWILVVIQDQLL